MFRLKPLQKCRFSNTHGEHIILSRRVAFFKNFIMFSQESLLSGVRSRSYSCSSPKISLGKSRLVRDFTVCNSSEGEHYLPYIFATILSQGRVLVKAHKIYKGSRQEFSILFSQLIFLSLAKSFSHQISDKLKIRF